MRIIAICNRAIEFLFYALFFLVPLFFLPVNYELFEFNKMMLTYAITVLIGTFWAIKIVASGRFILQRTPLDIPILLFLASQIISTIVSIDIHTSIWGYYSRFNGGLLSTLTYIFLYYAFVSNITKVKRLLLIALASGTLVAIYGVLEKMGIDKDFWVQDVQNRVFSTLGQPNWLAAYLSVLIPIAIALGFQKTQNTQKASQSAKSDNLKFRNTDSLIYRVFRVFWILLPALFYLTLIFTKSRSGFLGLGVGMTVFFLLSFPRKRESRDAGSPIKSGMTRGILAIIIALTFIIGSPFEQLNKFSLTTLISPTTNDSPRGEAGQQPTTKPQGPALETGGTESGDIRKIVWKGAIDIAKAHPLFGSGVETFAYSYYKFRPVEHNRVSEWDFLYNKAHNEYLNYLSNTGFFGLGSYLLMIGWFFTTVIPNLFRDLNHRSKEMLKHPPAAMQQLRAGVQHDKNSLLTLALLASYISILVSNFFGFSVVVINLFFFLIPAFIFVLNGQLNSKDSFVFKVPTKTIAISNFKFQISNLFIIPILLATYYILYTTYQIWDADRDYAKGRSLNKSGEYAEAYPLLVSAIEKRPGEPLFSEEFSSNTAALAILALEENESTLSSKLVAESIRQSDYTIKRQPNNPNFWRVRVRVFYTLSQIDEKYIDQALEAAEKTRELSPTDPKVLYNYALILGQAGKRDEAITKLEQAIALKPDYRDPVYGLGLFYFEAATDKKGSVINGEQLQKAIVQMEQVLKISSGDSEAREKLEEWKKL